MQATLYTNTKPKFKFQINAQLSYNKKHKSANTIKTTKTRYLKTH